jgi:riboflavin kinase/FMN adenylyltransferase
MQVFYSLEGYQAGTTPIVTMGTFDGLHLGHHSILQRITSRAHEVGGEAVVVSFHPHPRQVLQPQDPGAQHNPLRLLHTLDEKLAALAAAGVDKVLLVPFTRDFSRWSSQQYIEQVLIQTCQVRHLVVGYDHRFGAQRGGGLDELRAYASQHGFEVEEIPAQEIDAAAISSTRIRQALQSGDIATANALLGYSYVLTGRVGHGRKLGRTLGYPTANLVLADATKLVPADGVYAVAVRLGHLRLPGMLSIGVRPTVGDALARTIEVNLIHFRGNLYDRTLTLEFLAHLRPERKFDSMEALTEAMAQDQHHALAVWAQHLPTWI